jgi:hypothetical protein
MNTTKLIRCGYCGQLETLAQARECGRLDAETPPDPEPADRELYNQHRFEVWG